MNLRDDASIWWNGVQSEEIHALSNKEYEKIFLDKCSHAKIKDKDCTKGLFSCDNSILQVHGCLLKKKVIVSINPSCIHNFINIQLVNRLQVSTKNIEGTHVAGENVQFFKDLKLSVDKYVLHSNFYAIDMDDVDIVLGYPWMNLVGIVNINVQNKFLKLWYKKKKVTLQDVSLSKTEGLTMGESEVESETKSIEGAEAKPHEGHNNEAKEVINSKAQYVTYLKKKEQIPTIVVDRHPHHIEKQQSSRKGCELQHIYAPDKKPIKRCMEDYRH
jgi:hypothetical protein